MTLTIRTPDELAAAFERCAAKALSMAHNAVSPKARREARAEAQAFQQAADMVRSCTFVGWLQLNEEIQSYLYALLGADNVSEAAAVWNLNPIVRKQAHDAVRYRYS